MDVLLTGASGRVGTAILDHLDGHDVALLDRDEPPERHADADFHRADVRELEPVREALSGRDAVVHLAADPRCDASWERAHEVNIGGTRTVLEAARRAGVEQVAFASSNHVQGMYEVEGAPAIYEPDHGLTVDHTDPIRPDSYYGTSKAAGEHLGRQYVEVYDDPPDQFHALRICSVRTPEYDHPFGNAERAVDAGEIDRGSDAYAESVARQRAMWHSRRDLATLVDRCLAHREPGFDVFYGVSDNERRWFDLSHARETIGYEPRDSAEEWDEPP